MAAIATSVFIVFSRGPLGDRMAPSDSPRQPIDCYDYDLGTEGTVFWEVFYKFMNRPYDRTYRRAIKEPRERVLDYKSLRSSSVVRAT